MDGKSFSKLCQEAPDLGEYIGRTDVDLIFSKAKPLGVRRLEYEHFLDALLQLAIRIYPEEEPTKVSYIVDRYYRGYSSRWLGEHRLFIVKPWSCSIIYVYHYGHAMLDE